MGYRTFQEACERVRGKYYSSGQFAAHLGIAECTLATWLRLGKVPQPSRVGRSPFWRIEVVTAWEADGRPACTRD